MRRIVGLFSRFVRLSWFIMTTCIVVSCGAPGVGNFADFTSAQFFGAGKLTPNLDGTWTLWWPVMSISEGVTYDIFQVQKGNPYNFSTPVTNTASNTYQTSDLRIVGNTCFVVRALQNGEKVDSNTKEVCTDHEPYKFDGIEELVSLKDGTYMVRWEPPPFAGGVFQILTRKKDEKNLMPLAMSEQSFFQTEKIALSQSVCFVVQHRIQGLPEDKNIKELCTTEEQSGGFNGLVGFSIPKQGAIRLWWLPSTRANVQRYRIYLGTSFQRVVAVVAGPEVCKEQTYEGQNKVWCTFEQENLSHAASYTYGVRALDAFEREDDNKKAITIELLNHPPVISTVKVEPTSSVNGRPSSVTCSTEYSDVDAWQKIVPTFTFKNRKREQVGDVDLQKTTLPAGTKSTTYALKSDDRHGDVITCQVSLNDGFDGTNTLSSAPAAASSGIGTSYLIPDTPAIATSIKDTTLDGIDFVYGVKNLSREVTLSLNAGYSDVDADPAAQVIVTNVVNGNVCLITDASCTVDAIGNWTSGSTKIFPCQSDGTCKFQFIPKKDHFTDPSDFLNTLARVEYKIEVADVVLPDGTKSVGSTSPTTGILRMNVRPAPRATGFAFVGGQQDKDYLLETVGNLDTNSNPLNNGRFLQKGKLASGVLKGFTPNVRWMGYESSLPITKMYTRIALNSSDQPTERPNGEFNQAEMRAQGVNVTCSKETYFENESTATDKRREVLTSCEITCRSPSEAEIREIYSRRGAMGEAALAGILNDNKLRICPFLFKPKSGFYGTSVFYYSVLDQNGIPSEYARAEINFSPSLRAIGHTTTVVEGEDAPILFSELPDGSQALTGFDGSSPPDVIVSSVEVKDSQIRYNDIFQTFNFSCDASNTCGATAGALAAGGSWPGYGTAYYIYRIRGVDTKVGNAVVLSNWCPAQSTADPAGCKAEVRYYPKPRATTASFAVLENSTTQLSLEAGEVSSARGYNHPYGDKATVLNIKNYDSTRGAIVELAAAAAGSISCDSGSCPFTITTPENPCAGNWLACNMSVDYSVVTRAGPESELPTTPTDKRNLESAPATATVTVRPLPKPNSIAYLQKEGETFLITISNGTQAAVNGASGGYEYPIAGVVAKSIQVVGNIPNGGGLIGGGFTCNSISCTATYVPGAGFTGTTSFDFKVSVFDSVMNRDVQSSATGKVSITIRPTPKATGLLGGNRIIAVEGVPQSFFVKYGVPPETLGYTHAEGTPAQSVTTVPSSGDVLQNSNSMSMGTIADIGGGVRFQCSPATKNCSATFNPIATSGSWPGYGDGKFRYTVSVADPLLGIVTSAAADAAIEVRPAPRAIGDQTLSTGPVNFITVEGDVRTFSISQGRGYTHPYNARAVELTILGTQNGAVSGALCNSEGVCSFTFEPANGFKGEATVSYGVRVADPLVDFPPFNGKIESGQTSTKVLVYPRPLATNQLLVGLQNKVKNLLLEPNTATNYNKGGYEHFYGDKAFCVKVSNARNGSVSNFTCGADGRCVAAFTPTSHYYSATSSDFAGFDYEVYVQKDGVPNDTVGLCPDAVTGRPLVGSNKGTVDINVRPIPVATGLTVVNKQGDSFVVELKSGNNLGYKDLGTPARNPSNADFSGPAVPSTAGTFSPWNCTTNLGVCTSTFTPNTTNGNPESAYFGDVDIPYLVSMFDADTQTHVNSDPATLKLRLRPLPVATNLTADVKQGQNYPISLSTTPASNPTYTHPYNYKAYRVEFRSPAPAFAPAVAQNGQLKDANNNIGVSCNSVSGQCVSNFQPTQTSGDYYWGSEAKFEYRVVVSDQVVADANAGNGDVASTWKSFSLDYRPVPEPTGLIGTLFLKEGATKTVQLTWGSKAEKKGYAHGGPSFHLPLSNVTASPNSGTIGTLSDFACDPASETCQAVYTSPNTGTLYGPASFSYRVEVNDPKLGALQSYTSNTINLQVNPIPKTTSRSLMGVQDVSKTITLSIGNGYSYPADLLSTLLNPKIAVETFSAQNINVGLFSCDGATGVCLAIATPASNFTGAASFGFRVKVFDAQLGELVSNDSVYSIDFYPTPRGISLLNATNNHILAQEGFPKTFSLLPSKIGSGGVPTFCNTSDATSGFPKGYLHALCSPAVEILVDSASLTNATVPAPFTCSGSGVCTGTAVPNPVSGPWQGYGLASFNYRVRIDPPELRNIGLSAAEVAALTSQPATLQVEFMPRPKTKDLQFWAVEDFQMVQNIVRCNDSLIENCDLGYVQGYNRNASDVVLANQTKLSLAGPFSCDAAGLCTGNIKPQAGYFSLQNVVTDRATVDFKVRVDGVESNVSKLIFNVYPRPKSAVKLAEGVQNEELDITFAPSQGYTHAESGIANRLVLMAPSGGVFLNTAACVDFDTPSNTCRAYSCSMGVCTARFRQGTVESPFADFSGAANVYFRVEMDGPAGLPATLKSGLVSDWAETRMTILPKPIAGTPEIVIKENEQKPFSFTRPAAYTHKTNADASKILLPNNPVVAGKIPVYDVNNFQKGLLSESSFNCSVGSCSNVFIPAANQFGPALLNYRVEVSGNSRLTSDNVGIATFDIRPVPDSINTTLVYEVEGTARPFELGQDNGFFHPYNQGGTVSFPPKRLTAVNLTSGTLGTWVYENGVAKNIFTPTSSWVPDATNNKASFSFSLSVDDPKLGSIDSDPAQKGKFEVEYRPLPRTQNVSFRGVENSNTTFTISRGAGYTHAHSLNASDIEFRNFSRASLVAKACEPASGICTTTFQPEPDYYGNVTAQFRVKIVDALLPEAKRNLWSDWSNLTIDVRPLPRPVTLVLKGAQDISNSLQFGIQTAATPAYTIAYRHPYFSSAQPSVYVAKSMRISFLSSGSFTGTGVTFDAGVYTLPCVASGICSATYVPTNGFTGVATFKQSVVVSDPLLNQDLTSPLGDGEYRVRPVPVGVNFNISAAETKTGEQRSATIQFGASKDGFSYPSTPVLDIADVTVVDQTALNGTLTSLSCTAGVCTTQYQPTAGFFGPASFTFKVWVDDGEIGRVGSAVARTVTIDVRPRPTIAAFTKEIAESNADNPTTTDIKINLDNSAMVGYKQLNSLKAFAITTPSANNGTAGAATCVSSTGECTVSFTPNQNFSGGNATFTYSVKVIDPALGATQPANVLESEVGVITLPVRARPVAQNKTFYAAQGASLSINLAKGASLGYTHGLYNATGTNVLTWDESKLLSLPSFTCTLGTCTATVAPKLPETLGTAALTYQVKVPDPVLGVDLWSNTAALNVIYKAVPKVLGSPHALATIENTPLQITFSKTDKYNYDDESTWDSVKGSIKIIISGATKGTFDGGVTNKEYTCDASGACSVTYTPSTGQYGQEVLSYSVSLTDPNLGVLTSASTGTINLKIRPRPHTNNVAAKMVNQNMSGVAASEGRQLTFTAGTEFTYAYKDDPSAFSNMRIVVSPATKGKFFDGTSLVTTHTAACASNVCSVKYVPDQNLVDADSFNYKIVVFDTVLNQDIQSLETTVAAVDIFPAPTCSDTAVQVNQFTNAALSLTKGSGWNHARTGVVPSTIRTEPGVVNTLNTPLNGVLTAADFTCTTGTCTATFLPTNSNFRSETATADEHKGIINFRVGVVGEAALGTLYSANACAYRVTFYPIAVTSNMLNVAQVEGVLYSAIINLGDEYSHPWGHKATKVEVAAANDLFSAVTATGGAALDANSQASCDANGDCKLDARPKPNSSASGLYGISAASNTTTANFSFRVLVNGLWSTSDPNSLNTTPSRIYFNKRPQARPSGRTFAVRQGGLIPADAFVISNGNGMTTDANFTDANCTGFALVGATGSGPWTTSKGSVSLPATGSPCAATYTAAAASYGSENLNYKISAPDKVLGSVWFDLPTLTGSGVNYVPITVDVRPKPVVTGKTIFLAESATGFTAAQPVSISKQPWTDSTGTSGYRHPYDPTPSTFNAISGTAGIQVSNATGGTLGTATCNASGACTVDFTPNTNVTGTNASSFAYRVSVTDAALNSGDNTIQSDAGTVSINVKARPRTTATVKKVLVAQGATNVLLPIAKTTEYTHSTLNANAVVLKTQTSMTVASQTCTAGTCTLTVNPTPADFVGTAHITYAVTVEDTDLGSSLESPSPNATAEVQFRPRPVIETAPTGVVTSQGTTVNVSFVRNTNFSYTELEATPAKTITLKASSPSGGTFNGASTFSIACDSSCLVPFTPSAATTSNSTGTTGGGSFVYTVEVTDPLLSNQVLGPLGVTTGTVKVEVRARPTVVSTVPASGSIRVYENLNNQTITITRQGSGQNYEGHSYEYYQDATLRDTMVIKALSASVGTFDAGNTTSTGNCSDNDALSCQLSYNTSAGQTGAATIQFKTEVTDNRMPSGSQTITATTQGAINLDIYPRPVCNAVTAFANQGETPTVRIASGATSGYTHARSDVATSAALVAASAVNGTVTSTVTCSSGNCDFTFTPPSNSFASSEDGTTTVAKFNFNVTVGGIGTITPCTATVVFKPKVTVEPPTGLFVYEGQPKTITIQKSTSLGANQGYHHPWTGVNSQATSIQVVGTTRGTFDAAPFTCAAGICTRVFNPIAGTATTDYGANTSSITYNVTTGTSPYDSVSTNGVILMNLRPVPKIQALSLKMIENTPLSLSIGGGLNGYVWGVSGLTQEEPAQVATVKVSGFDIDPTFTCSGSSPCQANVTTTTDFSRGTTGAVAQFRYRIKTFDSVSNSDVWSHLGTSSTWPLVTIDVAPRPRATGRTYTTGRSGMPLNIELSRDSGYTHVQSFNASAITVNACDNCASTPTFSCSTPGANGLCTATLSPATSFTSITGEPNPPGEASAFNHTGKDFGWARITYTVNVNDAGYGGTISSPTTQSLWVYFRPVPMTNPYSAASPLQLNDGVEDASYIVSLTEGNGWSYGRSADRKPNALTVFNVSGGTATSLNCAGGACQVSLSAPTTYPTFGSLTFDYNVRATDPDSVNVSSTEKTGAGPGRVTVAFRARPRLQDIGNTQLSSGFVGALALETCKEDSTHDTTRRPTFQITSGTFNAGTGAPNQTTGYYHWQNRGPQSLTVQTASESQGQVVSNACDGTTCTVSWQPRCWNEGEDQITGQFQFKITDTQGLLSKGNAATATILSVPRIKTTGLSYPKGDSTQGISGIAKTVQIAAGAGNGYTHILSAEGKNATKVKIVGGTGFSSPTINSVITNCTAGTCTFDITPTIADSTANIEYQVGDSDGFISRAKGILSVYFASPPVATSVTHTVAQGSSNNVLTIALGAGYAHPANDKATSIVITGTANLNAANGTSLTDTSFVCSNGTCTANYTPNPAYSSAEGSPASFTYKVKIGTTLLSAADGTYSIDVYPKPTVRNQDLFWVQGVGRWDDAVLAADRFNMTLAKGPAPSAYSVRGTENAASIEEVYLTAGSGTLTQEFTCSTGTCTGKFQPLGTLYSANETTAAVSMSYKVRVQKGSVTVDSDPATIRIFIMPVPATNNVSLSVWEDATQDFRFVDNVTGFPASPSPVAAFTFPWATWWSKSLAITTPPTEPLTVSNFDCNYAGGGCYTIIDPTPGLAGNNQFSFALTAQASGNWPKAYSSSASVASIIVKKALGSANYTAPQGSQSGAAIVTVNVTLARGSEWIDLRNPSTGILSGIDVVDSTGYACSGKTERVTGTLGGFTSTDGGATWNATFTSTAGAFGWNCFSFKARRTVNGKTFYSPSSEITVYVKAEDQPAAVCDKTRLGTVYAEPNDVAHGTSVIAIAGRAREVKGEKGFCSADGWYLDPDNNAQDNAQQITFTQLPTIGSITGCSTAPCNITCNTTTGNCPFTYNPPATTGTDAHFKYTVTTKNNTLNIVKVSPEASGIFQIVTAPTPRAKNTSVTVLEDAGVPVSVSSTNGLMLETLQQMNLRDGSDGYSWAPTVRVLSCDSTPWHWYSFPIEVPCDANGNCSVTVHTDHDRNGTSTCYWNAVANGVTSTTGAVVATITPVDDPPQTIANNYDYVAHQGYHRYSYFGTCREQSDWLATFKNRKTKAGLMQGMDDCKNVYGYFDRDGDKATEVQISAANRVGIGTISNFTCDAAGRCLADVTPATNFVGTASFEYKVKTCYGGNTSLCSWQPSWSKYHLEVSEKDSKPVSKPGSSLVVQGGTTPIIFFYQDTASNWDGVTPPTDAGKYFKKPFRGTRSDMWWRTAYTKRVLTSNLTGGSSANFTCDWDNGVCVGLFTAAPGFVGDGGFDYVLRHNEGYTAYTSHDAAGWGSFYNYGDELLIDSDPVRWAVTVKAAPAPTGLSLTGAMNQSLNITLKLGTGLGYTHTNASPASAVTVRNASLGGGTLGNFTCNAAGDCTALFTPATNYLGAATFDYFITDSQTPTSYTSHSSGLVTIQIEPAILLSTVTRTGLTEGTNTAIAVVRQAYPSSGTLVGEGYAHKDNLPASTLTASGFSSGSLSGTGVTCNAGTCTVNCAADGEADANTCSFNFVPSNATFYGTATFNYTLTVGSTVSEQKAVSLTYKARPTLKATALAVNAIQGQNLSLNFDFNSVTTGEYGYTHPESGKATAITLSSLTNISEVGTPTCDANGLCTVVVKHSTDGFGAASFDYNVTVGGLTATTARTVNVTFQEVPVSVAGKTSTTDVNTAVAITFNKGDEYTMNGVASRIVTSNALNGTTVDADGTTAKTDFICGGGTGNCVIRFRPATNYAGNAGSFDFIVYNGTAQSIARTYVVKVDGAPVTQAQNAGGVVGGTATPVTLALNVGYTDPNNDLATLVETQNVLNGALSTIACGATGICTGTFTPNQTFTGNATFEFRVTTRDTTLNVNKVSSWSTFTLAATAADEAPVATGTMINSANRAGQSVTIALNDGYTDANSDKASALTIQWVDGATTSTPTCDAAGSCTFTVTASAGSFGQSVVQYTVTANGKTSNSSLLTLNYATNSANGCVTNLAWGTMTMSDSCGLTLAATPTTDGTCSIYSTSGVIRNISTGAVASNAGGMSATLTEFPTTTRLFSASWNVLTDLDSGALQRSLKLTSAAPTALRASTLASTPVRGQGINGQQAPVAGCTGACAIDNSASASALASSAGGSVSVGAEFACAADGSGARCWGRNAYGQLGNGNQTDQTYATPVDTSGLSGSGIVAVSAGSEFVCGLLSTGEVACWGRNDKGQLGDLTNTNRSLPVYVKRNSTTRLSNIVSISAGDFHACAVSASKAVWCWGDGDSGALGVANTAAVNYAAPVKSSGIATAANLANAVAISSKGRTNCIVQDNAGVQKSLCWGRNDSGQLGRGSARNVTVSVSSIDTSTERLTSTSHGLSDGDAVTLSGSTTLPAPIASTTQVYFVKLIDTDTVQLLAASDSATPVDLTTTGSAVKLNRVYPFPAPMKIDASTDLTGVRGLALQASASCALMSDGKVRCAGSNANGSTGLNSSTGSTDYLSLVRNSTNNGDLNNVVALSGGSSHSCALLSTGAVQCWGANSSGQLGDGSTTSALVPVSANTLTNAVAIATGGSTTCALQRSNESNIIFGRVKCWGSNSFGVLGNGVGGASQTTVGDAVRLDGSTFFGARYKDCGTVYSVSDAP